MIRKSRILISLFLIGACVLAGLSLNKVPFIKENVNTTLTPTITSKSQFTFGLDEVCIDYKGTGNNNINTELPPRKECVKYGDNDTFEPIGNFLGWYHKAYIVLVISLGVLSLQTILMVFNKNSLNSFVAYIIRSVLTTGVIVMFLCLLISPVILKNAMGLNNDKLKESGINVFDGYTLAPKYWDLGIIFLLVITGLLMLVNIIFNVTKK